MKTLYAALIALSALACASVQPAQVQVGDRCLRCRRPIGDLRVAGEIIDSMRAPFPFRTAGCMAKYVKTNSGGSYTALFVTDYNTGRMFPAGEAWFVPATITGPDGKTGEPDYYAFRSREEAASFKSDNAKFMRWSEIVAAAN